MATEAPTTKSSFSSCSSSSSPAVADVRKKKRRQVPLGTCAEVVSGGTDVCVGSDYDDGDEKDAEAEAAGVPYVEIDGTPYYSDRFYLNSSLLDSHRRGRRRRSPAKEDETNLALGAAGASSSSECSPSASDSGSNKRGRCCRCRRRRRRGGAGGGGSSPSPPPLFDRSKLVESLSLKAAILGTYCFEVSTLQSEFPSLFGSATSTSGSCIPTLVLHGHRGRTVSHFYETKRPAGDSQDSTASALRGGGESGSTWGEATTAGGSHASLCTQEGSAQNGGKPSSKKDAAAIMHTDEIYDSHDEDDSSHCPATAAEDPNDCDRERVLLPDTAHVTEVCSTWTRPEDVPIRSNLLNDDGTLSEYAIKARRFRKGVHHPKFMILFETSGSVVVTVSTGNLTQPFTNDGTWIQRFHPKHVEEKNRMDHNENDNDCSDFGEVLGDFLFRQTLSTRDGHLTPLGFVQRYLGYRCLADLQRKFDFSSAQVHLVATVPGNHEGRLSDQHAQNSKKRRPRFYGRQRVADILHRVADTRRLLRPWLSADSLLSNDDRLIIQPTSFGSDWGKWNMSDVVRSFLGCDDRRGTVTSQKQKPTTDDELLKRLDIIWPTDDFMRNCRDSLQRFFPNGRDRNSLGSVVVHFGLDDKEPGGQDGRSSAGQEKGKAEEEKENEGYLFLSSETFNKIDLDCLSRMAFYEESVPRQRSKTLIPHFKSIVRLHEGNRFRERVPRGEIFSWLIMTSACLSRGAQGDIISESDRLPGSDAVSYANFELGILFCSRIQENGRTDRLYCFNPNTCECSCSDGPPPTHKRRVVQSLSHPRVVHLPVPFHLRPERYQAEPCFGFGGEDEDSDGDEVEFCETPYIHEVPSGTGFVGNMRITPYGAVLAAKYEEEG